MRRAPEGAEQHAGAWAESARLATLQFGAALALVAGALVLFQIYSRRVTERRARRGTPEPYDEPPR